MKTNKYSSFPALRYVLMAVALVFCFAQSEGKAQDTLYHYNVDSDGHYAAYLWGGTSYFTVREDLTIQTSTYLNWYMYWHRNGWIYNGNTTLLYTGGHDLGRYVGDEPYKQENRDKFLNAQPGEFVGDWLLLPSFSVPADERFRVRIDAGNISPGVTNRFEIWIVDNGYHSSPADYLRWGPIISESNVTSTELTTYISSSLDITDGATKSFRIAIRKFGGVGSWDMMIDNPTVVTGMAYDISVGSESVNGGIGEITDPGVNQIEEESNVSYTMTPAGPCSVISSVTVDGVADNGWQADPTAPYTVSFENVQSAHDVKVEFTKLKYAFSYHTDDPTLCQIIPTILPDENGLIDCGSNQFCDFEIAEGYEVDRIVVDGETYTMPLTSWSFNNYEKDHSIELYVKPQRLNVRASVDGTGGSVSPELATVDYGATHSVTITPDPGNVIFYLLVDGVQYNNVTENIYTFENITTPHTLRARFRPEGDYSITALAGAGGQVTTTEVSKGQWTLLAIPDQCYEFKNWTNLAGEDISTDNTVLIAELKSDSTLQANFIPVTEQFDIAVQSNDETLGTVSQVTGNDLTCGTVVTLKATPTAGNVFMNWTDQDDNILYFINPENNTETPYMPEAELAVTRDMTVTAHFSSTVTLSLATNPPNLGITPVGGNTYLPLETVSYSVDAVPGYRFLNWTDSETDSIVSAVRANEIMMTRNYSLVANFVKTRTLVVKSDPAGAATLAGLGVYVDSTYATFSATPKREYAFIDWTREIVDINPAGDTLGIREVVVSTNLQDSIFMDTNYTITANFVFATPADPVITTVAATNITNSTAVLNGNIEDIGVPAATAKGFEYSTVNEFVEGTGTVAITAGRMEVGQYRTTITQLAPNTQYYFRAFVDYEGTRKYGAEIGFSTNDIDPVVPVVITNATTDITETTATLNGNLSNIGYPAADAIGFSYSTSDDFANSIEVAVDMKEGDFFANISNLTANTTYYTKAWADVADTRYEGETMSFTTLEHQTNYTLGELNLQMIVSITAAEPKIAAFSATLLNDGGTTEDAELGFVYSTTPNPAVDNAATKLTVDEVKLGAFVDTAFDLECETTYYVRGFYTNEIGTVYTAEVDFTTKCVGIEDVINNTTVKLYPNPTNESTTLSLDLLHDCNMKITLCDLSGSEMMTIFDGFATGSFVKNIQTADIVAGTYFVKIQIGKDSIIEKLIVK